jgi:hypothetical protein
MSNMPDRTVKALLTSNAIFLLVSYFLYLERADTHLLAFAGILIVPTTIGLAALIWRPIGIRYYQLAWLTIQLSFVFLVCSQSKHLNLLWVLLGLILSELCWRKPQAKQPAAAPESMFKAAMSKLCAATGKQRVQLFNETEWEHAIQGEPQAALIYWNGMPGLRERIETVIGIPLGRVTLAETIKAKAPALAQVTESFLSAI